MTQTSKCSKCKKTKGADYFYTNPARKNGLSNWCISCMKGYRSKSAQNLAESLRKLNERNESSQNHATMNRQPWTAAEEELIIDCWATEKADDIALVLGRTFYAVKQRAKVLGLRNLRKHPSD